ncbi:Ger(x)C family spore germination protein [Shimazuella soli]|uniref:Ger(x)C family spore germination protein n=1 Tax=Shimazuella soli TaxID=1892854 RepID=UPI00210514EB|nr:Ger(x)C family spore germination protein [Shimazuella soli]
MRKKNLLLILILIVSIMVTGCWSRKELNDIALVIGLGVDKVGDDYILSTQVVDPGEIASKGGSGRVPVITYKTRARTLIGAVRKLTSSTPRKLYLSHLRMFVIGESVVKDGVAPVLDFITRDHELRSDFFIIMTRDSRAQDVLTMVTPLEKVPSTYMYTMLNHAEKYWTAYTTQKIDQLDNDIASDGKEAVISAIEIKGSLKEGEQKKNVEDIALKNYLQYTSLGVLHKDKLVGYLEETEASGYKYVINKVKSTVVDMPCNKQRKDVTEIIHSKTTIRTRVKNHKPSAIVQVHAEANVAELQCQADLLKQNVINVLETKTENEIKHQIVKALQKTQKEYHADVFGFGNNIHQSNAKEWKKLKKDWGKTFSTMPVKIEVKVEIRNFGKVNKTTPSLD